MKSLDKFFQWLYSSVELKNQQFVQCLMAPMWYERQLQNKMSITLSNIIIFSIDSNSNNFTNFHTLSGIRQQIKWRIGGRVILKY